MVVPRGAGVGAHGVPHTAAAGLTQAAEQLRTDELFDHLVNIGRVQRTATERLHGPGGLPHLLSWTAPPARAGKVETLGPDDAPGHRVGGR